MAADTVRLAAPHWTVTRRHIVPALVGGTVLLQVCYPLVSGPVRDAVTAAVVACAAAGALAHAALSRGRRTVLALAGVTVCGGFGVEVLGVHTGLPFGDYSYDGSLGPRLLQVPVVIALAWTMLAWPAALAARRLARSATGRVLVGGWALAAWDVFLDPQMVAAGHWHWHHVGAFLPGVPDVPLSNFAGWLLVSLAMSWALQRVMLGEDGCPSSDGTTDGWPLGFYIWTWASSALALAAFLHLPAAALWGFGAMGTVAVPLLVRLARHASSRA